MSVVIRGDGTVTGITGLTLPTQTGHAGEYLTTNGTAASWAAVASGGGGETPLNYAALIGPDTGEEFNPAAAAINEYGDAFFVGEYFDGTTGAPMFCRHRPFNRDGVAVGTGPEIILKYITGTTDGARFTGIAATPDGGFYGVGYKDPDLLESFLVRVSAWGYVEWSRIFAATTGETEPIEGIVVDDYDGSVTVGFRCQTAGTTEVYNISRSGNTEWSHAIDHSTSTFDRARLQKAAGRGVWMIVGCSGAPLDTDVLYVDATGATGHIGFSGMSIAQSYDVCVDDEGLVWIFDSTNLEMHVFARHDNAVAKRSVALTTFTSWPNVRLTPAVGGGVWIYGNVTDGTTPKAAAFRIRIDDSGSLTMVQSGGVIWTMTNGSPTLWNMAMTFEMIALIQRQSGEIFCLIRGGNKVHLYALPFTGSNYTATYAAYSATAVATYDNAELSFSTASVTTTPSDVTPTNFTVGASTLTVSTGTLDIMGGVPSTSPGATTPTFA